MIGPKDIEPRDDETYESKGQRPDEAPLSEMGTYESRGARDGEERNDLVND